MRRFPGFTKEQLEWLEEVFPERSPHITDTDREIWVKVGQVEVVRRLRKEYEQGLSTVIPHP